MGIVSRYVRTRIDRGRDVCVCVTWSVEFSDSWVTEVASSTTPEAVGCRTLLVHAPGGTVLHLSTT